jgi:glycine cleavage system H protein
MRPENLKYRPSHEWVRIDGEFAWIGITDFAVSHLSDLVFLDLPDIGTDLMSNEPFGEIESVKAVSDLYSPITAEVVEQNEALLGDLSILSKSPFDEGWMIKVRIQKPEELDQLLDATAYEEIVKAEEDNA